MTIVHAHRGASAYAPENTMPAFRLAMEMGADGIELDIHLTKDRHFVVCHDGSVERCSNGTGQIHEMTLQQLRALDFGSWFSPRFAGTLISTLEEVLEAVRNLTVLNIELKGPLPDGQDLDEALSILYRTLKKYPVGQRVILSTFWHDWAGRLRELYPDMRTGLLYGETYTAAQTLELAARFQASAVHPALNGVTPEIVRACHAKGLLVNVWTVDRPEDIEKAVSLGVDGIISNVPDRVLRALGRN